MKILSSIIVACIALLVLGCGEEKSSNVETIPNGEIVVLDDNQTVGYVPNTDVQIVNIGDGAFYISCNEGECPVHIGDLSEDTTNSTDVVDSNNTTIN